MKSTKSSILPFDPISLEYDSFVTFITPPMARYLLEHHNFDNREKKPAQVNKIAQSVDTFGWLLDGKGVCFNTDGNLTEKQHTLTYISRSVSYTHLRAHETSLHLVCRLLLEKKK